MEVHERKGLSPEELEQIIGDYDNPNSLGSRFRARRSAPLRGVAFALTGRTPQKREPAEGGSRCVAAALFCLFKYLR
ncbi:MAG: hypothetical protein EON54_08680 [Alcaligenaceae bacterium]|nr:MAG: hypothetical protein EON54_08680 [Alcaligenaceae bacterium]